MILYGFDRNHIEVPPLQTWQTCCWYESREGVRNWLCERRSARAAAGLPGGFPSRASRFASLKTWLGVALGYPPLRVLVAIAQTGRFRGSADCRSIFQLFYLYYFSHLFVSFVIHLIPVIKYVPA